MSGWAGDGGGLTSLKSKDYLKPDWAQANDPLNWQHYIAPAVREVWKDFGLSLQRMLAKNAQLLANRARLELTSDMEGFQFTESDRESALTPEWDLVGRVHDWRNYIAKETQANWERIPLLGRILLVQMADRMAEGEHWD
jgi:hypothetical protein